jgi:hypothetical protein
MSWRATALQRRLDAYAGIGHRSHPDRRFWELQQLVRRSYELVRAGLTRRQRAELESETGSVGRT